MKKTKLALRILKKMDVDKIIIGYLILTLFSSFVLVRVEPQINNIFDGMWYCFVTMITIGFGDIVAVTLMGRLITVLVALYGIVVVAIITGVLINYYQELNKLKVNKSIEKFLYKLEKLPELSKEELTEISEKVKSGRYKL